MAANKVVVNNQTILDLTGDTVTAGTLKMGVTAHDKSGVKVTGTLEVPTQQTKTVELSMASGDQTITPDSGKVLSKVTVNKPSTLIPENIKKDVEIGGVTGTLEEGGESTRETWVWNMNADVSSGSTFETSISYTFTKDGEARNGIIIIIGGGITYVDESGDVTDAIGSYIGQWNDYIFRKITFLEPPTGDLLTYLEANAVKQPSDVAVQTDKTVTITSNGTTSITPDVPYDALSKVDVTANVADNISVAVYPHDNDLSAIYYNGTVVWLMNSKGEDVRQMMRLYGPRYADASVAKSVFLYYVSAGDRIAFRRTASGTAERLPEVTGGAQLISGAVGSSADIVYEITGDCTFKHLPSFYCLIAGTLITLADGTKKPIENITRNDNLLVWDFYNGCFTSAKPLWIKVKQTAAEYNRVTFSNGAIVGFVGEGGDKGYHRIFNEEAGAFTHTGTADTPDGIHTFCEDASKPTVVKQEIVRNVVDFYNIITVKHFNLFANGILTSCKCSNLYKIEDMRYTGERLISDKDVEGYFNRLECSGRFYNIVTD